jgi:S-adenosylmethionine synthetase
MYDTPEIEELIKELLPNFDLQEAWIAELLDLVIQKYPSLDVYGSKENLKRDIKQIIENVVNKKELNP